LIRVSARRRIAEQPAFYRFVVRTIWREYDSSYRRQPHGLRQVSSCGIFRRMAKAFSHYPLFALDEALDEGDSENRKVRRSLRFDGETDDQFLQRAKRAAKIARLLIDACLQNECVQDYLADNSVLLDEKSVKANPIVRIEYEQAIAFGGIGETLAATKSKHWGEGPYLLPLQPADWFYAERITYQFRENSLYNRRYEQRRLMKQLLGKDLRKLVGDANYKRHGWEIFRDNYLTPQREQQIESRLGLTAKEFWRAARGKVLYTHLPLAERQPQLFDMQLD